jgi:hypothetical protein
VATSPAGRRFASTTSGPQSANREVCDVRTKKSKVGLRERLQTKGHERQDRKAERMDRARREGARRPEDIRRDPGIGPGHGTSDLGGGGF